MDRKVFPGALQRPRKRVDPIVFALDAACARIVGSWIGPPILSITRTVA